MEAEPESFEAGAWSSAAKHTSRCPGILPMQRFGTSKSLAGPSAHTLTPELILVKKMKISRPPIVKGARMAEGGPGRMPMPPTDPCSTSPSAAVKLSRIWTRGL